MMGSGISSGVSSRSVTEHQALIARAAGVHAHGDIGGLRLDHIENAAGLGIEAHLGVGEADVGDHFAGQLGNVQNGLGGDFARHHANAGGNQRFASHAARRDLLPNTASSTASEIWSAILSGCPSVTDSDVKICRIFSDTE